MRILVAEDDEGLREVLVLGLTDAGYHVDAVDRGDDAIDQLKWYEYDVAVIDWRMPGAEGIDVVAWARKHERPTGLLMLTARDTPADRIRGLDTGADDYLVKPFDFGELLARVRAFQRRRAVWTPRSCAAGAWPSTPSPVRSPWVAPSARSPPRSTGSSSSCSAGCRPWWIARPSRSTPGRTRRSRWAPTPSTSS